MNVEAFILVGGRSSRFGGEKSLARMDGKTLAERAAATVREALPLSRITFVTREPGHFEDEAERVGIGCVPDLLPGCGPVGGLHTALAFCDAEWLFLFACDLPFVDPNLIASLRRFAEGGHVAAVVPRQPDGRLQPLCAFYRVAAIERAVEELIRKGSEPPSMRDLLALIEPRFVEPEEYGAASKQCFFRNINTREDLERAAGG